MLGCGLGEGRRRQDDECEADDGGAPEMPDHVGSLPVVQPGPHFASDLCIENP
jgi:hypothetical protein